MRQFRSEFHVEPGLSAFVERPRASSTSAGAPAQIDKCLYRYPSVTGENENIDISEAAAHLVHKPVSR